MANIFEFLSKDGNITPEKARKSRQMQFHDKTAYVWMGILPLKRHVNRDKCSFETKQRMFGVFAIDEILRYRGTRFPSSCTLCHPGDKYIYIISYACLALLVLKATYTKKNYSSWTPGTDFAFFDAKFYALLILP